MKISIKNRLSMFLRQRQISSASEFGRRMTAAGYPMSSSHASRYEKENAPAFDLKFLNVACNVLQCLPNELYEITVELDADEDIDPLLILPRHAIVVRRNAASNPDGNTPGPAVQPTTVQTSNLPNTPEKQKTAKMKAKKPSDTGPTGAIFPFLKK